MSSYYYCFHKTAKRSPTNHPITLNDDNRKIRTRYDRFLSCHCPTDLHHHGNITPFSPPTCCRNQNRIPCRYIHYPSIPREMGRQWQDELMAWYECIWKSLIGRTDYWKRDKNVAPVERDIFGDREWNGNRRFSGLTELQRRKRVRNRVKSWLTPIVELFIAQETRNV